jgi:uncharacterized protein (TIGR02118 family)
VIKLSVIYETPPDPPAFDAHYLGTHAPMCDELPGIVRCEVTKFTNGMDGSPPANYLQTDLVFETKDALMAALGSVQGQALVADMANLQGTKTVMTLGDIAR